jgi:hypothetical protein
LSKEQAELFGSRLKWWNLLHRYTEWCFFRNRHNDFKEFFSEEYDLVFCNDACTLSYRLLDTTQFSWGRLFIDSSKASLKAVLVHNGNQLPSVPPARFLWKYETTFGNQPVRKI